MEWWFQIYLLVVSVYFWKAILKFGQSWVRKKARRVAPDPGESLVVSPGSSPSGHIDSRSTIGREKPPISRSLPSESCGSDSDSGWEMTSPAGNHSRLVRAKKRSKERL